MAKNTVNMNSAKKIVYIAGKEDQAAIRQCFLEETRINWDPQNGGRRDVLCKYPELNYFPGESYSNRYCSFSSAFSFYIDENNLLDKKWKIDKIKLGKTKKAILVESKNGHKLVVNGKTKLHNWYLLHLTEAENDILYTFFNKYVERRHARLRVRPCEFDSGEIGFVIDEATPLR